MSHTVILTGVPALTRLGHALADNARAQVLLALREAPACPADLARALGYCESTMDVHVDCLLRSGLIEQVEGASSGSWVRLADPILAPALERLAGLVLAGDPSWAPDHCTCGRDRPAPGLVVESLAEAGSSSPGSECSSSASPW